MRTTSSNWAATCSGSGWAKIVRIDRGDHRPGMSCGTAASTLRMKCTRQRCHDEPMNTVPIAAFSPV